MGTHPINLAVRFLLEICALISVGMWGWKQSDGLTKFILAIGMPLVLAIIWGVFAVPNDPSRSGSAPIATPGLIRIFIELGIFGVAIWSLYDIEFQKLCLIFGIAVIAHYVLSYDRILWLIKN